MIDRPRGRVLRTVLIERTLAAYAAALPVGSTVRHAGGRTGVVREDSAHHVPGIHLGKSTAHCLTDVYGNSALVCVVFQTEAGVPLRAWVPVETVEVISPGRVNRPSLGTGGR